MIYEPGNAAKQWMLEELDRQHGQSSVRILDLACGSGRIWQRFVETHPNVRIVGVDTDASAIEKGKKMYEGKPQMELRLFDAQLPLEESLFDVVVAMSAIEHVVDRPAFLKTTWSALKSGGVAYLNYDVGHFRSHDFKERLMVPISQLMAVFGKEGPYMKRVDDGLFRSQAEKQGFLVTATRKHNLHPLKGFMRGASEEALSAWFAFEEALNAQFTPEQLDRIMWSTTLILQKT